jgi:hypothetical protein
VSLFLLLLRDGIENLTSLKIEGIGAFDCARASKQTSMSSVTYVLRVCRST